MRRYTRGNNGGDPVAIDPASGFKVPHARLVKQWDGEYIFDRFVDKRNPQDFVRGITEKQTIPNPRPEPPDTFVADWLEWESGAIMTAQNGDVLLTEGVDPGDTL